MSITTLIPESSHHFDLLVTRAPGIVEAAFPGPPTATLVGFGLAFIFDVPAACCLAVIDEDDLMVPPTTREPCPVVLDLVAVTFKTLSLEVVGLLTGSAVGGGGGGGRACSSIDSELESGSTGEPAILRIRESGEGTVGAYEFFFINCCVRDGG